MATDRNNDEMLNRREKDSEESTDTSSGKASHKKEGSADSDFNMASENDMDMNDVEER
jgi:hypothetical protein